VSYEQTPDDHTLCRKCGSLVRDQRTHDAWHVRIDAIEEALQAAAWILLRGGGERSYEPGGPDDPAYHRELRP
jgi:hypothetical protein